MERETTSLSLLERLAEDDASAWNRLAELYEPLIHRWIARFDVPPQDADDLCQDVLVVVAENVHSFKHNKRTGAFRNWLKTMLINRLRDYWRKRNARPGELWKLARF